MLALRLDRALGYTGYDVFYGPEGATEVACWAHARRYFEKAEATDPKLAKEALERIGRLYAIEQAAKAEGLGEVALAERRARLARPELDSLCDWLTVTRTQVGPHTSEAAMILPQPAVIQMHFAGRLRLNPGDMGKQRSDTD